MKLFNRKKNTSAADDIQNYYDTERRERTGVAWLLAGATLVVTLLLALGIFYGGRWAYRALVDDGNDTTEVSQDEQNDSTDTDQTETPAVDTNDTDQNQDEDAESPLTTDEDETDSSTTNETETSSTSENTRSGNLPSSGPSLPATGPTEPEL